MDDGNRSPGTMPWRGVAIVGALCAALFVGGRAWLRHEERNCEWECLNFPAVVGLLVLAAVAVICVLVLLVMAAVWLLRDLSRSDEDG